MPDTYLALPEKRVLKLDRGSSRREQVPPFEEIAIYTTIPPIIKKKRIEHTAGKRRDYIIVVNMANEVEGHRD